MKRGAVIVLLATILISGAAFWGSAQAQQSAALFFSPGSGSFGVGATFTLNIKVDSGGGSGINAGEAQVRFDKVKLQVSSISKAGSIFSLWPSEPTFSNADGSVTFAGGAPSAYSGNSGTILSITFKATAPGTAEVSYGSGSILAADGKGTNVLGETRKAILTIGGSVPPPPTPTTTKPSTTNTSRPGLPEVSSPTHADVNQWYAENDVEMRWTLPIGVTGIASAFDSVADTDPGTQSEGIAENTLFEDVDDGIWFYHIRFQNAAGWGDIAHRRILVDTTKPEPFEVTVVQSELTDPNPKLEFSTLDTLAGIARYEVAIGATESIALTSQEIALNNGTVIGPLPPGTHSVSVTAFDGALNFRTVSVDVVVDPIALPAITGYSEEVTEDSIFYVEGVGPERGIIIIRLTPIGEGDMIEREIPADSDGRWFYIDQNLPRGAYELTAQALDKIGAQSNFTEPLPVLVRRTPLLIKYGWLIMLVMLLAVMGLLVFWFLTRKHYEEERDRIREEVADLRARLRDVFSALHEETEEQARSFDKRPSLSEREEKILNKLEEALEISEELIGKEVADVERLLE